MSPTEWTIATLKEHYDRLLELDKEALRLQALEYERRLDVLNHAHAEILAAQKTYVSYSVLATIVSLVIAIAAIYFRGH